MRRLGYAVFLAFGMLLAALSPALAEDPPSRTTIVLAQEYWVYDQGQQVGPLAFQQVLDRIAMGQSNLGTQVWTSHLNAWVNIDTMPEFTTALAEAPVEYWLFDNNTQYGPLSLDEAIGRIERGESNAATQVWTMQLNAWVMLTAVPELAEALDDAGPQIAEGAAYYLYEFDQQKGPFSKQDLIDQIARGDIGKSGYVWTTGMADWVGIETIPEFAEAFAPEIEIAAPYYVIANGEQVGPLTDSEIRIRILDGLSTAEDLAWKKGLADWTPLSDFAELSDALAAVEGPPPLPGEEDGPPPLPRDDDHKVAITVVTPQDDGASLLFDDAMKVFELGLPGVAPTAPKSARVKALDCIAGRVAELKKDDLRVILDSGLDLSESQLAGLDASVPGFTDAVTACVEEAENMRDTLDALIWTVASETAGADAPPELALEAYACLREAIDPLSDEHRAEVAAEGMNLTDATAAMLENVYPGITATVEACEASLEAALGRPIDGGVVTPPVVEQPEVVVQPKDEGRPPVIVAPKTGVTEDGPEVVVDKEATVIQPKVVEQAKSVDERLRDVIQQVYEEQARDLPELIRKDMVACTSGKYGVLSDDEKELMIANKMMISEGEMARIEAAHPGLTASMSDCIPRF